MFQNISKDFEEEKNSYNNYETNKKEGLKETLKKSFSKQMVILYIVSFMLSTVSFQTNKDLAPFGIAILVAILSNCMPIGIVSTIVIITTAFIFGGQSALNLLLILLLVFLSILVRSPKYDEEASEKRKLGRRLFFSTLVVSLAQIIFKPILLYDVIFCFVYSICVYIFYKIFSNSIEVITKLGEKRAYSIEDIMGASLMFALAACSVKNINIYGYSIKNILCILIVLIMGWKSGILVGATAGVTIGSVVGIIGDTNPSIIATYALSRNGSRHI